MECTVTSKSNCEIYDVSTFRISEVPPNVLLCRNRERSGLFFAERRNINPLFAALPLHYWLMPKICQKVCNTDLLDFFYVYDECIIVSVWNNYMLNGTFEHGHCTLE